MSNPASLDNPQAVAARLADIGLNADLDELSAVCGHLAILEAMAAQLGVPEQIELLQAKSRP